MEINFEPDFNDNSGNFRVFDALLWTSVFGTKVVLIKYLREFIQQDFQKLIQGVIELSNTHYIFFIFFFYFFLYTVFLFCYNLQRWRKLHEMRVARKNHGLVVVDNKIYAVGGEGSTGKENNYYSVKESKYYCSIS